MTCAGTVSRVSGEVRREPVSLLRPNRVVMLSVVNTETGSVFWKLVWTHT